MARPKRSEADAYERIQTAFWDLLAEKPFEKITIEDLSKKAAVNHNLIYYYFENLYDMAEKLFKANQEEGQVQMIIQAVLGNADSSKKIAQQPDMQMRINRLRLFMREDSTYLNKIAKEEILNEWLKATNIDRTTLSDEERTDLEFIISGLSAVLGSALFDENPKAISEITSRPLGKGVLETIRNLTR